MRVCLVALISNLKKLKELFRPKLLRNKAGQHDLPNTFWENNKYIIIYIIIIIIIDESIIDVKSKQALLLEVLDFYSPMSERDEQISFLLKLQIDQLEASDLFNTGSRWDKQDPSVTIVIGPKKFQTARSEITFYLFGLIYKNDLKGI